METEPKDDQYGEQETVLRRDALLLKLLKTPPQPRPKRERSVKPQRRKALKKGG